MPVTHYGISVELLIFTDRFSEGLYELMAHDKGKRWITYNFLVISILGILLGLAHSL